MSNQGYETSKSTTEPPSSVSPIKKKRKRKISFVTPQRVSIDPNEYCHVLAMGAIENCDDMKHEYAELDSQVKKLRYEGNIIPRDLSKRRLQIHYEVEKNKMQEKKVRKALSIAENEMRRITCREENGETIDEEMEEKWNVWVQIKKKCEEVLKNVSIENGEKIEARRCYFNSFKSTFTHHPTDYSDILIKDTISPYEKEKCELEKLRHEMEKLLEDKCPLPMGKITEMEMLSDKVNRAEKEVKEVQNALYVAEREIKKIQEDKVYSMKRATIWNGWLEITKKGEEILKHVQLTDLFDTRRSTTHVQN